MDPRHHKQTLTASVNLLGVMRPSVGPLVALCVVVVYRVGQASGQLTAAGQTVHIKDGNFSKRDHIKQESIQDQADPHPWSGLYHQSSDTVKLVFDVDDDSYLTL